MRTLATALGRHPWVAAAALGLCLTASAASLRVLPAEHEVRTRFLDAPSPVLRALGNPRLDAGDDGSRGDGAELVLRDPRRLGRLAAETGLFEAADAARPAPLRWVEERLARLSGAPAEERLRERVDDLDTRLAISARGDEVTVALRWPDAASAVRFVERAASELQAWRAAGEVADVSRAVAILEARAAALAAGVDAGRAGLTGASAGPAVPARAPRGVAGDVEAQQLLAALHAERSARREVERWQAERVAAAEGALAEGRARLGPANPELAALARRLEAARVEAPDLAALRAREEAADAAWRASAGTAAPELDPAEPGPALAVPPAATPEVEAGRGHLALGLARHEDVVSRLRAARIDRDAVRAARAAVDAFAVLEPARAPRRPRWPSTAAAAGAGIAAGLVLACVLALWVEVHPGADS
jgi:hypothetical protein